MCVTLYIYIYIHTYIHMRKTGIGGETERTASGDAGGGGPADESSSVVKALY